MSYRPITDVWILARPKVKYYGAYPNGFLERALPMIGVSGHDEVLHLCGGHAKSYPNKRMVLNARTVDADPGTDPDFLIDLSAGIPSIGSWPGVIADPPYTESDHGHYQTGGAAMPSANHILRVAIAQLQKPGQRVGILHYIWPQPPKNARSIACIGVVVGFNNRMRCFSVFERIS